MATEQAWVPPTEQERKTLQSDEQDRCEAGLESGSPSEVARCREAEILRAEIVDVGRKLWEREYVDGNGGNISARLGSEYLLCTPTKMCKRDMRPEDLCLSDLGGNTLAGDRIRTSELLLHLEIFKANSRARAIVHCHPPYATAFAMTGSTPPIGLISEYESLDRSRGGGAVRDSREHRNLLRRFCLLWRTTIQFCWPTTASCAGPTP